MTTSERFAPGWPGIPPRWTSSAKSGVGTSPTQASHVWFTVSHGILDETYFPDVDWACTRDMGLIVTDGKGFFSEEKRHTRHEIEPLAPGVPAYRLRNTCVQGRYRIEKRILSSVRHDAVLQATRFEPLHGALDDYRAFVLLAPHLGNRGTGNDAWVGEFKGVPMLLARRGDTAIALACSAPWLARSAGFVGVSDGWRDLAEHKRLTREYERAEDGNVALTGEIDVTACGGEFLLVIGYGRDETKAAFRALAVLQEGFEHTRAEYVHGWQQWQATLLRRDTTVGSDRLHQASTAVLRVHESKSFSSAIIASLSIPWGFRKGDDDLGGYHLVWPRDLVEAAGGLLSVGAKRDAHHVMRYLAVTQDPDGHWPQNMWLDGSPFWSGVQLDEAALPILLVDLLRREDALSSADLSRLWPTIRRAAAFIVRTGPSTQQDRWEEATGLSPFTLAAEIAALLAAADIADLENEPRIARHFRETADAWNEGIERWTYVTDTPLARQLGIDGYYVRIAPPDDGTAESPHAGYVPMRLPSEAPVGDSADQVVSPDALALVRFGLRAPDDPRILNTIAAIDALLRVDLPYGPGWRRCNGDRYGEYDDGRPYDGGGVGRVWPLLTGERAHYELAAGRPQRALELLQVLERTANGAGLIPEQVWDGPPRPAAELVPGGASGSAMPLVWAHAEYLKLCRSIADGRVFDMPLQTVQRYVLQRIASPYAVWRFTPRRRTMAAGKVLRIETHAPAMVHWSADGWGTVVDTPTEDTGLGVFVADLETRELEEGATVEFTFYWSDVGKWEGANFSVRVVGAVAVQSGRA